MIYLRNLRHRVACLCAAVLFTLASFGQTAQAQGNPFEGGWTLQP